jgi:hypothetical protein
MDEFEVAVSYVQEPVGLTAIQLLRLSEIGEIFVVSEDLYGERGAMEVLTPGFQYLNNCEEFVVIDVVVPFC